MIGKISGWRMLAWPRTTPPGVVLRNSRQILIQLAAYDPPVSRHQP